MILELLIILAFIAAISWWLSGFDTALTGADQAADFTRRAARVAVTLFLMGIGVYEELNGAPLIMFLIITLPLAFVWVGCLSELFARGFHVLVDPTDNREFDPKQVSRDMDALARLVQQGRYEEAVESCRKLTESAEVSALAMETMLLHLYHEMFSDGQIEKSPALAEIQQLRAEKHFTEAEERLKQLLEKEPQNFAAALLLMRVYAQDFALPDKANALLEKLARQPHLPPEFASFASRSIREWSGAALPRQKTTEGIESLLVAEKPVPAPPPEPVPEEASVDELLKAGRRARAIEILERKISEQPQDFDLWMKLAEAHAVHCADLVRASKIFEKMKTNRAFSPDQIQLARAKLDEWRTRKRI